VTPAISFNRAASLPTGRAPRTSTINTGVVTDYVDDDIPF